ncbi:MAG: hypothetical protein H6707_02090 [Deltaproteobacteria bacterium]|nr:hypothetical protein [Deltaproteobacteria bacterium]
MKTTVRSLLTLIAAVLVGGWSIEAAANNSSFRLMSVSKVSEGRAVVSLSYNNRWMSAISANNNRFVTLSLCMESRQTQSLGPFDMHDAGSLSVTIDYRGCSVRSGERFTLRGIWPGGHTYGGFDSSKAAGWLTLP